MKQLTKQFLSTILVFILLFSCAIVPVLAYQQVGNGSQGSDVKTMQNMLNTVMNAGLTVDGICGAKSVDAIKKFQKAYGLTADGICGAKTWKALEDAYNKKINETTPKCISHKKGTFSHADTVHPHKQYYKCANCGATFTDGSTTTMSSCTTCNPPAQSTSAYKTVQNGSQGSDVKTMQNMLNTVMNAGLTVDGICGAKSVAAIKNFQKAYGLSADGICGKNTWAKLEAEYNKKVNATPEICTNHKKGTFSHADTVHPHKQYYKCANCGATFTDGLTTTMSSCTTCNPPAQSTSAYKTVQNGSQGSNVKTMQNMLNTVMNAGLTVDGICGAKSVDAIKKFQKAYGLTADGICGPKTWEKLEIAYNTGETVKPVASSINIGSGNYSPGTLNGGSTYSISGKITSTYRLTNVTVGIYNADGSKTNSVKTVSPNSTAYDIKNVDSYIKFGQLAGDENGKRYYFRVTATDANGTTKELVNNSFTVKSYKVIYSSYENVAAFQEKVLKTWIAPVNAKILEIPGTGRAFGANRANGRKHAGIDYYVSGGKGTPVYAMQSGTVIEYIQNFYYGTSAIGIQHADGSVARYCEISTSLKLGDSVKQGDKVAEIKANSLDGGTMLHLELYLGTVSGALTNYTNNYSYVSGKFNRRSDLINPEFLLALSK